MTLQEIADSISDEEVESYNKAFNKIRKNKPWLMDLLEHGYVALSDKVKIWTETNQWLPWEPACSLMDKVVLTVCYIYDRKITLLEREINELKLRLESAESNSTRN